MNAKYLSWYECPECGVKWTSLYDSACDDECPECGKSYSPNGYIEVPDEMPTDGSFSAVIEPAISGYSFTD